MRHAGSGYWCSKLCACYWSIRSQAMVYISGFSESLLGLQTCSRSHFFQAFIPWMHHEKEWSGLPVLHPGLPQHFSEGNERDCRGGVFLCVKNQQQHMGLWDNVWATKVCHLFRLTLPADSMSGYYQLPLSIIINRTHPRSIFRLAARKCWFCSSMQKSTWLYRRRLAWICKVYLKVLADSKDRDRANRNTTIVNRNSFSSTKLPPISCLTRTSHRSVQLNPRFYLLLVEVAAFISAG